ncbi:hypothetical protein [Leptospira sarikeiensis]|uniref:Uncharacterized protein n=1 Tax=Leptospira sarikeiensis TaxID=2484943 RepID=A0A4V3JR85_9LEPT|nr:hypothetical protein [Leptospira sarikeiensis]TGL59035.1 hypothetical protein EHQ64_16485 [Leptospira sarikeiensis]
MRFEPNRNKFRAWIIFLFFLFIGTLLVFGYEVVLFYECSPANYCFHFIRTPLRIFLVFSILSIPTFAIMKRYIIIGLIPYIVFIIACRYYDPYFSKSQLRRSFVFGAISIFGIPHYSEISIQEILSSE